MSTVQAVTLMHAEPDGTATAHVMLRISKDGVEYYDRHGRWRILEDVERAWLPNPPPFPQSSDYLGDSTAASVAHAMEHMRLGDQADGLALDAYRNASGYDE